MPPKRKSTVKESAATPAKRVRSLASGQEDSQVATPQTGEKRKRGRPRKHPEDTPKPAADTPKRGRGRPRKVVSDAHTGTTPSPRPKRGRGRPRKDQDSTTSASTPKTDATPKNGRGRPRKSLPADGTDATTELKSEQPAPKKIGRGRPRKSVPANDADASTKLNSEKRTSDAPEKDIGRSYWLMKAEPESRLEKGVDVKFSIDDLAAAMQPEPWDGVRNAMARNLMREMKKGDYAFFYHSNCKVPGVVGVMEIVQEHSVDESAFDSKHPYYDPKSSRDAPKWVVVHVEFRKKLQKQVTLNDLKSHAQPGKPLENLQTLKQSRLSVSSVTRAQWRFILELAGEDPDDSATRDAH